MPLFNSVANEYSPFEVPTSEWIDDQMGDDEAMYFAEYADAVIGVVTIAGESRVCYDWGAMIAIAMEYMEIAEYEAIEFLDNNVVPIKLGDRTPAILNRPEWGEGVIE